MIAAIVEIIASLLRAIPIVDRWFRKTPVEKADEAKSDFHDDMEKFKDSGRPSS